MTVSPIFLLCILSCISADTDSDIPISNANKNFRSAVINYLKKIEKKLSAYGMDKHHDVTKTTVDESSTTGMFYHLFKPLCLRHTVSTLTRDGHTNIQFLISREVTPEDGNKMVFFFQPKASRLLRQATR